MFGESLQKLCILEQIPGTSKLLLYNHQNKDMTQIDIEKKSLLLIEPELDVVMHLQKVKFICPLDENSCIAIGNCRSDSKVNQIVKY